MLWINLLGGLYLTADGRPLAGAAAQPRRLAVLALLTVAGDRGLSREQILNYLWPDNDEERGRHALTQALYSLRKDLNADQLFLGQQELRLNPDLIGSDYHAFHQAVRSHAPERAVESYQGPFLQGFHIPRADNFERWAEEQRDALAHEFGRMLELAATRATERKDHQTAVGYLKRRSAQDPLNAKVAVRLMEALFAQGAVVEALQHAKVHEAMVREELNLAVDPAVLALAERIRNAPRAAGPTVKQEPSSLPQDDAGQPVGPQLSAKAVSRQKKVLGLVAIAASAGVLLALVYPRRHQPSDDSDPRPVIAVGRIADYAGTEPGKLGQPMEDMLATNLARGSGFRVISNARMLEVIRRLKGAGDSDTAVSAAARQAGARELIDGALYALSGNRYRLDLRRIDLANGSVIRAYRVEGADLFALADSGTAGLVADVGGAAPRGPLATASTASFKAYQFYEDGLRRFYDGEIVLAERLFRQALDEDSGFAQAAYYYAKATSSDSRTETVDRLRRAVELSRNASDRERLVIQADWAANNYMPSLAAIAETLMVRYPDEIDGYFYAAQSATLLGDYMGAVAPYRKVLELDSLGFSDPAGRRCRVCEAYLGLSAVYSAVDSVDRCRALAREWVRRQPRAAQAWLALSAIYAYENQARLAVNAIRVADSLQPSNPANRHYMVSVRTTLGDYEEAERLLRAEMEIAPGRERDQSKWDLAVTLRQMGRYEEAAQLAREYRLSIRERSLPGGAPYNALQQGQVLFELGRYRESAALFDSIAVGQQGGLDPVLRYKDRIWAWVHEADARARLGDTVRLRVLADSMEVLGRSVIQALQKNLHNHVRGLLALQRGRDAEAEEWFKRSIISPVAGFTRSNHELARIYLRTGRPNDAIAILRPATHGGMMGANLYITMTELQRDLAEAFEAAGQRDSALVYYRKVLKAWARGDNRLAPTRDSLARRVALLDVRP